MYIDFDRNEEIFKSFNVQIADRDKEYSIKFSNKDVNHQRQCLMVEHNFNREELHSLINQLYLPQSFQNFVLNILHSNLDQNIFDLYLGRDKDNDRIYIGMPLKAMGYRLEQKNNKLSQNKYLSLDAEEFKQYIEDILKQCFPNNYSEIYLNLLSNIGELICDYRRFVKLDSNLAKTFYIGLKDSKIKNNIDHISNIVNIITNKDINIIKGFLEEVADYDLSMLGISNDFSATIYYRKLLG